jgi:hypothetical protein
MPTPNPIPGPEEALQLIETKSKDLELECQQVFSAATTLDELAAAKLALLGMGSHFNVIVQLLLYVPPQSGVEQKTWDLRSRIMDGYRAREADLSF